MKSLELKIKNKHLSEEARIIRFEENKLRRQLDWLKDNGMDQGHTEYAQKHNSFMNLKSHRREDVRNENRATYIARAFIEGKSYKKVESKRKPEREHEFYYYILPRVLKMIQKYGGSQHGNLTKEGLQEWIEA